MLKNKDQSAINWGDNDNEKEWHQTFCVFKNHWQQCGDDNELFDELTDVWKWFVFCVRLEDSWI